CARRTRKYVWERKLLSQLRCDDTDPHFHGRAFSDKAHRISSACFANTNKQTPVKSLHSGTRARNALTNSLKSNQSQVGFFLPQFPSLVKKGVLGRCRSYSTDRRVSLPPFLHCDGLDGRQLGNDTWLQENT